MVKSVSLRLKLVRVVLEKIVLSAVFFAVMCALWVTIDTGGPWMAIGFLCGIGVAQVGHRAKYGGWFT